MEEDPVLGFPNITIVIVDPATPGNVGFAARVMANFGVSRLRIVGPDIRQNQYAQIYAVRAGAILDSAEIFNDLESALKDMQASWAATARSGSNHSVTRAPVPLQELPDPTAIPSQVALVFGRESDGLFNEELALCDLLFTIPTSKDYQSMNLSHAIAVTLYELYTKYAAKPERQPMDIRPATREEREQVAIFFDDLVDLTRIKDFRIPICKQVFRNLLGRAFMTGREIATLTGTVRKIMELVDSKEDSE